VTGIDWNSGLVLGSCRLSGVPDPCYSGARARVWSRPRSREQPNFNGECTFPHSIEVSGNIVAA
jgi:hypothetical protein